MKPTPIHELEGQLATVGRIRAGRKTRTRSGKVAPQAINAFRFTSSDESSLHQVAEIYGGSVRPWTDNSSPDRFELYSDASEIRVALPRNALTQWYELWEGGGCQRRCDGITCTLMQGAGQDGNEPLEAECLCARRGVVDCKKKSRLSVLLPEVRLLGTWRYDTTSDIAGSELKAAVELIEAIQAQGIQRAVMRLVERRARGKRRQFTIASLGLDESLDGLIAGAGRVAALPGRSSTATSPPEMDAPALAAGETNDGVSGFLTQWEKEHEVVEAEIVGEGDAPAPGGAPLADSKLIVAWLETLSSHQRAKALTRARELVDQFGGVMPARFEDIDLDLASIIQEEWLRA
jgi:hypothetical protein